MSRVFLSLGSNLGDRHTLLLSAIDLLARRVGRLVRASSFIETEPWGFTSPHRFLNAVVLLETTLSPLDLLHETQAIECQLGRTRKTPSATSSSSSAVGGFPADTPPLPSYSDRPIDIDILLYDDLRLSTPELTIPHPHMYERDFVLRPLREVQSSLTH